MADEVQIKFGADIGGAVAALNTLKQAVAGAARREADRIALPYRQAFDEIGAGWRAAVTGLIEGSESFGSAALAAVRSVERGVIGMIETTASKMAAGPLASLLGTAAPGAG